MARGEHVTEGRRFDESTRWEMRPLKTVVDLRTSNVDKKSSPDEQPVLLCNYTDVYYSTEIADPSGFMRATATPEEIRRFRLRRGDVIITKDSESADDIAVPAHVARDFDDVVCGYHLAILRPRQELIGKYLYYVLLTDRVRDQFSLGANGITRFGLSQGVINNVIVPVPDIGTQHDIATFLDRETARIDTLIEKKQQLLDLLEEKRTALITQAVTRGLDPSVPMKDSGVEWIGEIPEHWEAVKLKYLAHLRSGKSITSSKIKEVGTYPVYGGGGLRGYSEGYTHDGEFALIGRQGAHAGNVRYGTGKFWASEHAVVVRPKCGVKIRWLGEVLRAMKLKRYAEAAAQPGIAVSEVSALLVPHPPPEEQRQIAVEIRKAWVKQEQVSTQVSKALCLLQEYRSSIISAAVTGKIDVTEPILVPA